MARFLSCFIVTLTAFGLAGCSGLTTSKVPPATVYLMHAAATPTAPELAQGQERPVLSVPVPAVPPGFDTTQIALHFNDGRQLDYYSGARWPANLGTLIQNVIIETGRDTLRNAAIAEPDLNIPTSYKLAINVIDFQPVYKGGTDSSPDLVVSLNFKLIRYPEESLALDFTLGRTAPGVTNDLTTVTAGLENALQVILAEALMEIDRAILPVFTQNPPETLQ